MGSFFRNLSLITTTTLVAILAIWLGQRHALYSQECSMDLDSVVLLQREEFPYFFLTPQEKSSEERKSNDIPIRIHPCHVFSTDYFEARDAFRKAVQELKVIQKKHQQQQSTPPAQDDYEEASSSSSQASIQLYTLPVVPERDYTMDIAVIPGNNETTASGLVIHSSGVHGVEGYAGAAIQLAFIKSLLSQQWQNQASSSSSFSSLPTIVLIHAVNPFGMARYRRSNEHNVDLNRNGIADWSFMKENHANHENYARFDTTLFNLVDRPPNGILFFYKAIMAVIRHGIPRIKAAMVAGQYYQPKGIFYGGQGTVEPSIRLLQEWLENVFLEQRPIQKDEAITWVDVHTGLGKFGQDTLVNNFQSNSELASQLSYWFPNSSNTLSSTSSVNQEDAASSTTSSTKDDDDETAKDVIQGYDQARGFLADYLVKQVFGYSNDSTNSRVLQTVQEFGTVHNVLVGHALMTENSAYHYYYHDDQPDVALDWAKSTTGRVFYPQNREWRYQVLTRGLRVLHQAIQRSDQLSTTESSHVQ